MTDQLSAHPGRRSTDAAVADAIADPVRLAAVARSGLLDEPAGEALERLTRLAARVLGVPGALVNIVTRDQQVTAACAGPAAGEPGQAAAMADSFCRMEVGSGQPFLVEDARRHPQVRDSVWTRERGLVAYAGMPLTTTSGEVLGSLCVFDHQPRVWTEEEIALLGDLAAAASAEIRWRMAARDQATAEAENVRLLTAERAARAEAEAARQEAEHANRGKSQFLAVMSHELRTPLNAIAGYTDLLDMGLRGPVTEAQRSDLARIRHSQQHLLSLINDVLNFAKLEAGHVGFELADVPLAGALLAVEGLITPQARDRGLTYATDRCPPQLAVRADREKLEQVLLNLASNAVKFTDGPGAIQVSCDVDDAQVHIRVRDTGIGIPPDQQARIFDPFTQVDPRFVRAREGTGLGLAISRDLARGMGGDLRVESELGEGSTFTLTLPRAADVEGAEALDDDEGVLPGTVAARYRVLLEGQGVHAVLRALNERVPHRFTGLYRFDAPLLRNVALFDQEAPDEARGADAPLRETYCSIVGETEHPFGMGDAAEDERVAEHPAREPVISYCGALVRDPQGKPIGTLCHFDLRPQPVPAAEIPTMEAVAALLGEAVGAGK